MRASESAAHKGGGGSAGGAIGKRGECPSRPMRRIVGDVLESSEEYLSTDAECRADDSDVLRDDRREGVVGSDADGSASGSDAAASTATFADVPCGRRAAPAAAPDDDADADTASGAAASAATASGPSVEEAVDVGTDAEADDTAGSSDRAVQAGTGSLSSDVTTEGPAASPAYSEKPAMAVSAGSRGRLRKERSVLATTGGGSPPTSGGRAASTAGSVDNLVGVALKGRVASPSPSQQAAGVAAAATHEVPEPMSSGRRARAARRSAAATAAAATAAGAATAAAAAAAAAVSADPAAPAPPAIVVGSKPPKRTLEDVAAAVAAMNEEDDPLVEPTAPLSLLESAKYVLRREGRPMSIKAVVDMALGEGIWMSNCKTPKSSLASLLSIQRTKVRTGQIPCTFFTQLQRSGDNLVYDPKGLG